MTLDDRITELIAIGSSVTANCQIVSRIFRTFDLVSSTGFPLRCELPCLLLKPIHLQILPYAPFRPCDMSEPRRNQHKR